MITHRELRAGGKICCLPLPVMDLLYLSGQQIYNKFYNKPKCLQQIQVSNKATANGVWALNPKSLIA